MRLTAVTLAAVTLVATRAQAAVIEARAPFKHLFPRQSSICTTECSTFNNALDVCTTTSCLCTRAVAISLDRCVNCYWENGPTQAVLNAANDLIDSFDEACAAFDYPPISVTTGSTGPTSRPSFPSTSSDLPVTSSSSDLPVTLPPPSSSRSIPNVLPTDDDDLPEPTQTRVTNQVTIRPSETAGVPGIDSGDDNSDVPDILGAAVATSAQPVVIVLAALSAAALLF
ncbi:hypothetical protein CC1G_07945 [Coprinopsis cinerea okayama7|uniref:Extracellular membrane protein CFEM domain-containing protein n=1 Tax=Coprinopsis cinerea (strain Okayama-7 / 130 / ATCC MYA-4618 / FGSC 9003) TaxID=240176 RepID=A8P1Z2_COPC7|nr:hypothetical protein CC1G_07945 [Coprinopsis cinerea okayama7\|eukprot:XP_001838204.1 hypothetical protein CC1G_07945 [Coprinopsis cinerea okayama7\